MNASPQDCETRQLSTLTTTDQHCPESLQQCDVKTSEKGIKSI